MTSEQRELLQALAYLYLRHGQNRRALTLALLAARQAPGDVGVLRLLAYAFVANDAPDEALDIIDQLERSDFAPGAERVRTLLKARALLHAGRRVEARAVFRQYVAARQASPAAITDIDLDVEAGEVIDHPSLAAETDAMIRAQGSPALMPGEAGRREVSVK